MVVGEFTQETDLVVIGGGPAGFSAAFRAAELGVQTIIVDSRPECALGGVCLYDGCIPSKTLLQIAEHARAGEQAAPFGIAYTKPKVDLKAVRSWKDKTISTLASGLHSRGRKHGVERIAGRAHFEDSRHIALRDAAIPRIRFRRALIATGSAPRVHPNIPFDGEHVLTPGEALALELIPATLLIVGDDYMAVELATIFAALGSQVTLAAEHGQLLPECDADLVRPLTKRLGSLVKAIHAKTAVAGAKITGQSIRVSFEGDDAIKPAKYDRVIVTAGHLGNTRGLQLEKTGVKMNIDEFVMLTDAQMHTHDPRILAAGDVAGAPLLADKASHQGRVAAEVIAGKDAVFDARSIPSTIFTDPQIAWCGMTEGAATSQGDAVAVARVPWGASGRAVGMGRSEGLTKIIYDKSSQLVLGVAMVGSHACEMIAEGALAMEMGATLTDLAHTIHPHPTMSELLSDAARQAEV